MSQQAQEAQAGGATPPVLYGLEFIPGCNTPVEMRDEHARLNLQRDLPWLMPEPVKNRPLVVVGGGPSLKHRWREILDFGDDGIS